MWASRKRWCGEEERSKVAVSGVRESEEMEERGRRKTVPVRLLVGFCLCSSPEFCSPWTDDMVLLCCCICRKVLVLGAGISLGICESADLDRRRSGVVMRERGDGNLIFVLHSVRLIWGVLMLMELPWLLSR